MEDPHMVAKFVAFLVARGIVSSTMVKHVGNIRKVLVWRAGLGVTADEHNHLQALLYWVDVLNKQCTNLVVPSRAQHAMTNLPSAKEVVVWQLEVLQHSSLMLAHDINTHGTMHRHKTALASQDAAMLAMCFGFLPPLRLACVRTCLHPDFVQEHGGCMDLDCM